MDTLKFRCFTVLYVKSAGKHPCAFSFLWMLVMEFLERWLLDQTVWLFMAFVALCLALVGVYFWDVMWSFWMPPLTTVDLESGEGTQLCSEWAWCFMLCHLSLPCPLLLGASVPMVLDLPLSLPLGPGLSLGSAVPSPLPLPGWASVVLGLLPGSAQVSPAACWRGSSHLLPPTLD